jgi:2-(1,2-epoxy-1,2-dihydrophenyl)acetyl-CoA isomerase
MADIAPAGHATPGVVRFDVQDGVGRIVLGRPHARNAFHPPMVDGLARAATCCAEEEGVRTVLISAEGHSFTVGGDLDHFAAHIDDLPTQFDQMIGRYNETLCALAAIPVPVVCAVQGGVAGGGLGLLWCSDVVVLADDAKIATGFSRLGLSCDGGSSWFLPRMIGMRRAVDLMLLGRVLTATEAVDWGLANRVVARARLADEAMSVARSLATGPTTAYGEIRRLLRSAFDHELDRGLKAELEAIIRCGATIDGREGVAVMRNSA